MNCSICERLITNRDILSDEGGVPCGKCGTVVHLDCHRQHHDLVHIKKVKAPDRVLIGT